jgi:hypothetical protein
MPRVSLPASAAEASGVKTPDHEALLVGTEVPTSSGTAQSKSSERLYPEANGMRGARLAVAR